MMKKLCMLFVFLSSCICLGDGPCPKGDITGDCKVNMADLAQLAADWLTEGIVVPSPDITWVHISDSGITGHEGFIGDMSKYETTNDQYCLYLNSALATNTIRISGGIVYGNSGLYKDQVYFKTYQSLPDSQISYINGIFYVRSCDDISMASHPVVCVSWYGATAFASYYGWRLPTEWEWQAVADYDGSYTYGCGTTIDASKANCYSSVYANPLGLSRQPYTSTVGYYPAYGYGLCDIAGNAWEWTSGLYSTDYDSHGLRGGSWWLNDGYCAVAYRYGTVPHYLSYYSGFRVCR